MVIGKGKNDTMVELYVANIYENINDLKFNYFLSLVSEEKRNKLRKYCFIDDIKRSLYSEVLARWILTKKLNVNNDKIVLKYDGYGKPYIEYYNNYYFNVSHSGNWVVAAISNNHIGVDIEHIQEIDMSIAEQYFSYDEYKDIMSVDAKRMELFYTYWTLKESYIKLKGKGLYINLNSFTFKYNGTNYYVKEEMDNLHHKFMLYDSHYALAVSYLEEELNPNIIMVELNSIII